MSFNIILIQSILGLAALIGLGTLLRAAKVLKEEHSRIFAEVITKFTLPALIFGALSTHTFAFDKIKMPLVLITAEAACIAIAYIAGRALKLPRASMGSLILVSVFGSSAFLGYALIKEVFPTDMSALSDAIVISELGVASLIFTVGVMIARYFGADHAGPGEHIRTVLGFFYSPICISFVLGILFSLYPLPRQNFFVATLYQVVDTIGKANTIMVTLAIGLMLHLREIKKVAVIAVVAAVIKLFIEPLICLFLAGHLSFPELWKKVLVLEAAMPTSALSAVFAVRYKCNGELAASIVLISILLSAFTIIGLSAVFF